MPNGYSATDYAAAWYTPGGLAGVRAGVAPIGWTPGLGEMPSYRHPRTGAELPRRIAPSLGGSKYVDYQGKMYPTADLQAFLNTPEGQRWQASGAMGGEQTVGYLKTGEPAIQYVRGDWRPFSEFRQMVLGIAPTEVATPPTYRAGVAPTTRYGEPEPWYPPARWGRPIEEAVEYARPEYDPAYYRRLEEARPTVSPSRYEWMAGLRPELLRQWQATLPTTEAEFARKPYTVEYEVAPITSEAMAARVKELSKTMTLEAAEEMAGAWAKGELQRRAITAEEKARTGAAGLAKAAAKQRQAQFGAWVGAYPYREEWYRMAPQQRGIYPGRFAPPTRWTV